MGAEEFRSPEKYFHKWQTWGALGRATGRVVDFGRRVTGHVDSIYTFPAAVQVTHETEQTPAQASSLGQRALVGAVNK